MPPRLQIHNLHKSFATPVLKGVSLTLQPGEIHALVGENGAGKSTLMNILSGLLPMDQGELLLDGKAYQPVKARDAFNDGVSFVAQELSLLPTLTVAENIGLRHFPRNGASIDRKQLNYRAAKLLKNVGLDWISPDTLTAKLNLSEQQLVEIAKALSTGQDRGSHKLLLLDEPTAALTETQANHLHQIIRDLAKNGASIVYISHRLEDVLQVSDQVSILRDGEVIITEPASKLSVKDMITHMSGREAEDYSISTNSDQGDISVDIQKASTSNLVEPISLQCMQGEILGIAGLAGSGRTELLNAIYGIDPLVSGKILCRHRDNEMIEIHSPGQAVNAGIGYLAEERKTQGILSGLPISVNISLPALGRISSPTGLINFKKERQKTENLIQDLAIKCHNPEQTIESLSGGNQQKVLLGRWLFKDSHIFLLDEPTRGIDVGAKNRIYQKLHQLRNQGKCLIVVSSELEELMNTCDRIAVMSNRKLVSTFSRRKWSQDEILEAAFSEYNQERTSPESV
ncbi:sugar ABC transporter ATP-binding protein [Porticoccus sp. W117]|uniref:sugar ABC transporter ATP-binding protein n=1 Tax=Porticoccus sp. W117 TaxID=3054777 RepID=UPI002592B9F1|nr:sugar ABC transporter ATP-binding protein [Porticoccus sp. W117]MDM3872617.1 sugar ABC transporter ATP-binding protein [Porticoccus sp. W117]